MKMYSTFIPKAGGHLPGWGVYKSACFLAFVQISPEHLEPRYLTKTWNGIYLSGLLIQAEVINALIALRQYSSAKRA